MEQRISPDPCRCRDFSGLAGGQVMFLKGMPVFVFKKSRFNKQMIRTTDQINDFFTIGSAVSHVADIGDFLTFGDHRQFLREIAETPF